MTSYKDSPMSLKEAQFRLTNYSSVIKDYEKQIVQLKENCESTKKTVNQYENNIIMELFKNELIFKQHSENINNVIYIDSVEYRIIDSKIIDGIDDVIIMFEVDHNDKKYIAVKWGVFYGDILKWQDTYELIKINGTNLEISSMFNCKYSTSDQCYYLISSIKNSNKDCLFMAKKNGFDEQPDEWELMETETQVEGTFYNFDFLSLKNMKTLHNIINRESFICLGKTNNRIIGSILIFSTTTNKYMSYIIDNMIEEQVDFVDISNTETENHSTETSETSVFFAFAVGSGENIGIIAESGITLIFDTTAHDLQINKSNWHKLSTSSETYNKILSNYRWNRIKYDKNNKDFVVSFSSPINEDENNIASISIKYYQEDGIFISAISTKDNEHIETVDLSSNGQITLLSKSNGVFIRNQYILSNSIVKFHTREELKPLSLSHNGDVLFMLVRDEKQRCFNVYMQNYDISKQVKQSVNNYYIENDVENI